MIYKLIENNSLISDWLRELRDVNIQHDRQRFRRNIERIGEIIAYEISKTLIYKEVEINTPISKTTCNIISNQPIICSILRAGIPLHNGLLNYFDKADSGFIASYRQENIDIISIEQQYVAIPDINNRVLILADTMLGTGSSMIKVLDSLIKENIYLQEIHLVSVLASKVGIENILNIYPNVNIWTADIDEKLTSKSYLIPGLGDAGDLCYGQKINY